MNLRAKKIIGYSAVTVVFCIIVLTYLWKPGISVEDSAALNEKLKARIGKVTGKQARIVYLHLDALGASQKFRYAIVRYFAPGEEQSQFVSLYVDGSGKSFESENTCADSEGITPANGIPLEDMDFSIVAANVKRIRDRFMEEGKDWMGVSEYAIRYDTETGDFVHDVEVWHEQGSTLFKWAAQYITSVTPGEKVGYRISQNGTGELEEKE